MNKLMVLLVVLLVLNSGCNSVKLDDTYNKVLINFEKGDIKEATKLINMGLSSASEKNDKEYLYKFYILKSFVFLTKHNFLQASKIIDEMNKSINRIDIAKFNKKETKFDLILYTDTLNLLCRIENRNYELVIKSLKGTPFKKLDTGIIFLVFGKIHEAKILFKEIENSNENSQMTIDAKFFLTGIEIEEQSGSNELYRDFTGNSMPVYRFIKRMGTLQNSNE
jgi:hypothetical protein